MDFQVILAGGLFDEKDCFFTTKVWNAQNARAAAILVADDKTKPLITMDTREESGNTDYLDTMSPLSIAFLSMSPKLMIESIKSFIGAARVLENKGYTQITPHYIIWYCLDSFILSKQCKTQCINHGRYCAPDPEQKFSTRYDLKDVVVQNLRQVCVYKVAKENGKPWLWWDYVTDFAIRFPVKEKYTKECADGVIKSLDLDHKAIDKCIGGPEADKENCVLKAEQDAQIGKGSHGDVTILPTLVIINRQYRGKLDKGAVLKAICASFRETTEPANTAVCLSDDIQTNECLENNGGCWQDKAVNITACKQGDEFRMTASCVYPVGFDASLNSRLLSQAPSEHLYTLQFSVDATNNASIVLKIVHKNTLKSGVQAELIFFVAKLQTDGVTTLVEQLVD
ncbi:hypothetical protein ABZP36_015286 [Zizania latifolia]